MVLSELTDLPSHEEEKLVPKKKPWFQFLQGWGSQEKEEVFVRNKK
jgi:hypothetical protein